MTKLPNTYQEVEYIQSSGTQYIDTGYDIQTGDTVEIKFNMLTYTGGSSGEQWIYSIWGNYNGYRAGVNHGLWETGDGFTYDTTGYDTDIITTGTSSYDFSYSGYLFAQNEEGSVAHLNQGTQRLFYCKISSGGILVRDFVPCYRKSDNVIGLYDLVNNVFYTNAGTGTFTKGADVLPPKKYIDRYYLNGELYGIKFGGGGWQPGANTLCYYTFNDTLADASGNHANASNVSSCTFTSAYTGSTKKVLDKPNGSYIELPNTFLQSAQSEYTMLFWFKSSQSNAVWLMGCNSISDYDGNVEADIDNTGIGFLYGRTYSYRRQAKNTSTYRDGNRHLISIRRGTGDVIVGVDKNFTTTYYINTPNNYSIGGNGISWGIGTRSTDSGGGIETTSVFQLGDFITEDKYRTDAEVEAYIDQTKSLYGIS